MLSASQYFHFSVSYSRNKEEVLKFSIQSQNVNKMKLSVNILTEGPVFFHVQDARIRIFCYISNENLVKQLLTITFCSILNKDLLKQYVLSPF